VGVPNFLVERFCIRRGGVGVIGHVVSRFLSHGDSSEIHRVEIHREQMHRRF
jgi:hypothetical protein